MPRQRETRLELATLTLARERLNSVFAPGRNGPQDDYLPSTSTGVNADPAGRQTDPAALHGDHEKSANRLASWDAVTASKMTPMEARFRVAPNPDDASRLPYR